jgi:pSer/pThr/pTyr-binding forkhead associated (FHA) protein
MDDRSPAAEAERLPFRGHPPDGPPAPRRATVPLRLLLQPHGLVVELNRCETVAGRHTDVDLRLPLPDVSRRHCRFVYDDERWQVVDLNSMNGVFVNNEKVRQAVLRHHDTVRIGSFIFQVDLRSGELTVPMGPAAPEPVVQSIADALPADGPAPAPANRKAS